MCLSHHVGVQVWLDMVQASNPSKYILHEFLGIQNSCVLGAGVCVYVFALQCGNVFLLCVCFCHIGEEIVP